MSIQLPIFKMTSILTSLFLIILLSNANAKITYLSRQTSTYKKLANCSLTTTEPSPLVDLVKLKPAYITIKLEFIDETFTTDMSYLTDKQNAVDPLRWTWTSKGKGYLLRTLAPNFRHLSLGTLNSDVYNTVLNVSTTLCEGFMNVTDNAKLTAVSRFIIHAFRDAYASPPNPTIYDEFKVCQEFYTPISKVKGTFKAWLLNLHVFLYLPQSLQLQCWSSRDYRETIERNESFIWTSILYYTFLFAGGMCFPLFLGVTNQIRPPVYDGNSYRLYRYTSLPIGLKYFLFTWSDNNRMIWSIRRILLVTIIILANYAEAIFLRIFSYSYPIRRRSAFRSVINQDWFYVLRVLINTSYLLTFGVVLYRNSKKKTFLLESEGDRKRVFFFVKLRKQFYIPRPPNYYPWGNAMFWHIRHRLAMTADFRLIWNGFPVLDCLETRLGSRFCNRCLYLFLKLTFTVTMWIAILILYLPTMYILQLLFTSWHRSFSSMKEKRCTVILIQCFCWSLPIVGFFDTLRYISGIASNIANVCEYTITGIILNTFNLKPEFFITLTTLVYFVQAVTAFYNNYHRLHIMIIENATLMYQYFRLANTVKASKPTSNGTSQDSQTTRLQKGPTREEKSPEINFDGSFSCCSDQLMSPDSFGKVVHKTSISDHLFWFVVQKCKPVGWQIMKELLNLIGIAFALLVGFEILKEVNLQHQINEYTTFWFSLGISFAVPILNCTIHSKTNQAVQRHILDHEIEKAILCYRSKFPERLPIISLKEAAEFEDDEPLVSVVVTKEVDESCKQPLLTKQHKRYDKTTV